MRDGTARRRSMQEARGRKSNRRRDVGVCKVSTEGTREEPGGPCEPKSRVDPGSAGIPAGQAASASADAHHPRARALTAPARRPSQGERAALRARVPGRHPVFPDARLDGGRCKSCPPHGIAASASPTLLAHLSRAPLACRQGAQDSVTYWQSAPSSPSKPPSHTALPYPRPRHPPALPQRLSSSSPHPHFNSPSRLPVCCATTPSCCSHSLPTRSGTAIYTHDYRQTRHRRAADHRASPSSPTDESSSETISLPLSSAP